MQTGLHDTYTYTHTYTHCSKKLLRRMILISAYRSSQRNPHPSFRTFSIPGSYSPSLHRRSIAVSPLPESCISRRLPWTFRRIVCIATRIGGRKRRRRRPGVDGRAGGRSPGTLGTPAKSRVPVSRRYKSSVLRTKDKQTVRWRWQKCRQTNLNVSMLERKARQATFAVRDRLAELN